MLQKDPGKAEIPAIFLTARDEETDMLTAFDTGADDYVVKPFSMKVLLKRIEAVIGRNNREKQLACGEIILFPDKKQVYKNEKEIILTAREYQLLEYLMYNQGNVLTKENILEYVWGLDGQFVVDNTVSVRSTGCGKDRNRCRITDISEKCIWIGIQAGVRLEK